MFRPKDVTALLEQTSNLIRESTEMTARSRKSLRHTVNIVNRSRELLADWPLSGTPSLSAMLPYERAKPLGKRGVEPTKGIEEPNEPVLERVVEQDLIDEVVRLDGRHFVDCHIENCTLEYSGGPVVLEGTHFSGCRFRFAAEAALTLGMLECFGLIGSGTADSRFSPSGATLGRIN